METEILKLMNRWVLETKYNKANSLESYHKWYKTKEVINNECRQTI